METPLFLQRDGRHVFAVHHAPVTTSTGEAFVFCHPLAEEKLWAHRVFVGFARELAAAGHHVLRFDMTGNGDSDGDFRECSVSTALADVDAAVEGLRARCGAARVTLLGLRFGATLAALAAERRVDVGALILWAPIVDGARYMQELLRVNVATQSAVYREIRHDREQLVALLQTGTTVNVDGYEMALPLFEQTSAIRLDTMPKRHAGPALVVRVDRGSAAPAPDLDALVASYPAGSARRAEEEPFWKEIPRSYLSGAANLTRVTREWLDAALPAGRTGAA